VFFAASKIVNQELSQHVIVFCLYLSICKYAGFFWRTPYPICRDLSFFDFNLNNFVVPPTSCRTWNHTKSFVIHYTCFPFLVEFGIITQYGYCTNQPTSFIAFIIIIFAWKTSLFCKTSLRNLFLVGDRCFLVNLQNHSWFNRGIVHGEILVPQVTLKERIHVSLDF